MRIPIDREKEERVTKIVLHRTGIDLTGVPYQDAFVVLADLILKMDPLPPEREPVQFRMEVEGSWDEPLTKENFAAAKSSEQLGHTQVSDLKPFDGVVTEGFGGVLTAEALVSAAKQAVEFGGCSCGPFCCTCKWNDVDLKKKVEPLQAALIDKYINANDLKTAHELMLINGESWLQWRGKLKPDCECGAESIGCNSHSAWCQARESA